MMMKYKQSIRKECSTEEKLEHYCQKTMVSLPIQGVHNSWAHRIGYTVTSIKVFQLNQVSDRVIYY